jgi:serine/threonine-protein kinase
MGQNHVKKLLGKSFVKVLIGATLFLGSAVVFGLFALNVIIKHGEKVVVPNVVNKDVAEALDVLSGRGLELKKTGARNSSVIPENFVLSQDPLPGSVIKASTPVSVIISLGSQICVVPDLTGKTMREAEVEMISAGLKTGRISKLHYEKPTDTILAQSPVADQQVARETAIDLLISEGSLPLKYRLPNLKGLSLEKVGRNLQALGILVNDVVSKVDFEHQQGTVLDQNPRPGSLIRRGKSVSLVVSSLRGEGKRLERKYSVFIYQVPYGFRSKSVRIEVADPEGTRTVYDEVDEPGAGIRVVLGYSGQCTVRVYLDNELESERIMR